MFERAQKFDWAFERSLLNYGFGWWPVLSGVVVLVAVSGWWSWTRVTTSALVAASALILVAEVWRQSREGDALRAVQAQLFSGAAVVLVGLAAGAFLQRDVAAPGSVGLPLVWPVAVVLLTLAVVQLVTSSSRLLQDGQRQAERLAASERAAQAAELLALQQKLEPTLLLRVMGAVAARAETGPRAAERDVEHLAQYLRRSLTADHQPVTTLRDQVAMTREYVGILALVPEAPAIEWQIDPGAESVDVPAGVLRTFLDHAVSRCLRMSPVSTSPTSPTSPSGQTGTTVSIRAYCHAARFFLVVTDTAPPDPPTLAEPEALAALRSRIGAPPQRRVRVETHVMFEVDGSSKGTTQTLVLRLPEAG